VKTRSHRIVSLAIRVVPIAAVLAVVENSQVLATGGPKVW
jgi:hypothetical protein